MRSPSKVGVVREQVPIQLQFQHQSDRQNLMKMFIVVGPVDKASPGSKGGQQPLCCRAVVCPEGTE